MDNDWLSKEIWQIITSPHISFPKPTGPLQFRMGPGPVDLFSTRFNNTFAFDVKATVAGEEVSREELKGKLLGLQKHWKAEQAKLQDESAGPVKRSDTIISLSSDKTISLSAETQVEGGRRKIRLFSLDGDPSLFE